MTTVPWQQYIDTAGAGFESLPKGKYEAQVSACEAVKTSNGKDMLKCTFTVTQGPAANRKLWTNFVISPESSGAMAYFFKHMQALGLTREYFAQGPTMEQVAQALLGRTAVLDVDIQKEGQYKGNNEVNDVLPSTGVSALGQPVATIATPVPQTQPIAPPIPQVQVPAPVTPPPTPPAAEQPAPAPQVPLPEPTVPAAAEQPQMPQIPTLPVLPADKPF